MGEHSQAYWTALSLILQYPSKPEEKSEERERELDVLCSCGADGVKAIGNIHRAEIDQRHEQEKLAPQKGPSSCPCRPGMGSAVAWVFAQSDAVVAGRAMTATIRVNKKMENGSWARCSSEMQSKRSLVPSSLYTVMDRHSFRRGKAADVRI